MEKIKMTTPLVEMDGDEMTRILWKMIKDELILPFVDLKTEYYDLSLPNRDKTSDQVTIDSANATKKYGVAVKCATITPNAQRMTEYNLHEMWKSPNGTIRAMLDGTVFRTPITIPSIHAAVKYWKKPITIARHAYGDVYRDVELQVNEPGVAKLVFEGESGKREEVVVHEFKGPGVLLGQHNLDKSIRSFAHSCFQYALSLKQTIWFATKDTISKKYDGRFKAIFDEVFQEYKERFEAAHGTVTRHYYKYLKGEETSTNPIATIFAWSGAFRKRGEMDNLPELVNYANQLEAACFDTLNEGLVTKDLVNLMEGITPKALTSAEFLAAIRERLAKRLGA